MLIGNEFSSPVPDWVPVQEADSPFLSATVTIDWVTLVMPTGLEFFIIIFVMGTFALPAMVILADALASTTRAAIVEVQASSAVFQRLIRGAKIVRVLATVMIVLSLPLFAVGAKYFEVRRVTYSPT